MRRNLLYASRRAAGIRAALVKLPDAGEDVGVDGALGDQAFRAESQLVEPAESSAGAEYASDRRLRRNQGPHAGDDGARFLLHVAEVGELFGQFDQQFHRRDRALVGHAAGRLDEDGPLRDRGEGIASTGACRLPSCPSPAVAR